ncbi:MAG: YcaO-like family protein, partial [Parachlamydiaceae bacterium]
MTWKRLLPGFTKRLILAELRNGAEFDELKFPLQSMQHYKVIQFRSADSKEIAGLGASINLKDAYKIAYFEYLERKALFDYGIHCGFNSTNGIALHKFKFLASSSARSELFERDSFLLHWHSSTPFIPIEIKEIQDQLIPAINELKTLGYETRFGKTFLGEQETIVTTLMDSKTQGFALGLSSGRGTKKDIEKAF